MSAPVPTTKSPLASKVVATVLVSVTAPELPPPDGLHALLLDDGPTVLEALRRDPPRGRAEQNAAAAAAARDRIDACLQRSVPGWPLRPLGL